MWRDGKGAEWDGKRERRRGREAILEKKEKTGIINNGTRNKHVRNRVLREVTISAGRNSTDRNVVLMAHTTRGG